MQSVLQCFIDKGISIKGEQANKYSKWVHITFTLKSTNKCALPFNTKCRVYQKGERVSKVRASRYRK